MQNCAPGWLTFRGSPIPYLDDLDMRLGTFELKRFKWDFGPRVDAAVHGGFGDPGRVSTSWNIGGQRMDCSRQNYPPPPTLSTPQTSPAPGTMSRGMAMGMDAIKVGKSRLWNEMRDCVGRLHLITGVFQSGRNFREHENGKDWTCVSGFGNGE